MGFRDVRNVLIRALRAGSYQHELRGVVAGKNLLDTGEVSAEEVVSLLQCCRGDQYESSRYHYDSRVVVHIFHPRKGGVGWYVKCYILPAGEGADYGAVFISVHRSEHDKRPRRGGGSR